MQQFGKLRPLAGAPRRDLNGFRLKGLVLAKVAELDRQFADVDRRLAVLEKGAEVAKAETPRLAEART